jgi:hypothetical protein
MRAFEIISERSFEGRRCTKDCGGHYAGYKYALDRRKIDPCDSTSPSFNNGCEIASDQIRKNQIRKPRVRL